MAVIVTGVFPSRDQAEAAVRELRDRRFGSQYIGIALQSTSPAVRIAGAPTPPAMSIFDWLPNHRSTTLAKIGNALVAGQISDCLDRTSPSHDGTSSLTDALTCMGIPQLHAEWYDQEVQQGYSLVTVCTEQQDREAQAIMTQFGSLQVPSSQRTPKETPTASTTGRLAQIQQGTDVYTSDGYKVGTVQESDPSCIHVLSCSNLFVPPQRVQNVTNDRIVLNVPHDQMDRFDWTTCHPSHRATYQPGGPGVSGLPPQEHEGGVEIPIETPNSVNR